MVLQNIKVKDTDRNYIDKVKGDYPRNKVVTDALNMLRNGSLIIDLHKKQRLIRLLNSIENNIIIPVDKQRKVKREFDEVRRILGG